MKLNRIVPSAALMLMLGLVGCTSSEGRGFPTETVLPETTLSEADQTSADEALIRGVFYGESQECSNDDITSDVFEKCLRLAWENTFPPYREFITEAAFDSCVNSYLSQDSSRYWLEYSVPQLGSSLRTPTWKVTAIFNDESVWSYTPEEFGRTYLIRGKIVTKGDGAGEQDRDFHYVVADGRAYYFPNYDPCLAFKNT